MIVTIPHEATTKKAKSVAPNYDRFVADRAKNAKQNIADLVITKEMTREERRAAFLAAIGR